MFGFRDKTLDGVHLARGRLRCDNQTMWQADFWRLFRHAMLVDQKTESVLVPLNTGLDSQGKLELANSMQILNWLNCDIATEMSVTRLSE
jgi:hypothetical protein